MTYAAQIARESLADHPLCDEIQEISGEIVVTTACGLTLSQPYRKGKASAFWRLIERLNELYYA